MLAFVFCFLWHIDKIIKDVEQDVVCISVGCPVVPVLPLIHNLSAGDCALTCILSGEALNVLAYQALVWSVAQCVIVHRNVTTLTVNYVIEPLLQLALHRLAKVGCHEEEQDQD